MPLPKLHVAPLWKLLPVMITLPSVCPCTPVLGVTPLTTGAGGLRISTHTKSAVSDVPGRLEPA